MNAIETNPMKIALAMIMREDEVISDFVQRYSFREQDAAALKRMSAQRAAGPDLYEALCDLVDAAAEGDPRKHPDWDRRYSAAVSAIKKAETSK